VQDRRHRTATTSYDNNDIADRLRSMHYAAAIKLGITKIN